MYIQSWSLSFTLVREHIILYNILCIPVHQNKLFPCDERTAAIKMSSLAVEAAINEVTNVSYIVLISV